jgi:hypothetical protein
MIAYKSHSERIPYLCLANIAAEQKSLTWASPIATLPAMRDASRTGAAVQPASSTRRDLLLERFALHHLCMANR